MLTLHSHEIESYLRSKGLKLRQRGEKVESDICPFCHGGDSHDKKTFVVYLDANGGNYKCMRGSCGATGSFWQLAEHFGDDPKQFYSVDDGYKMTKGTHPPREVKKTFVKQEFILRPFTAEAREYLHKRGFTDELLESVALGCDEQGNICFEYYHKGELCLVKVREPKIAKGSDRKIRAKWSGGLGVLWGLEQCDEWDTLVITFGEYDRMALRQARVNNTVSVPNGDNDLNWIDTCWDSLERFKTIILWPDNDESGRKALQEVAARLGEHRIRVVHTEYKDANQMLGVLLSKMPREQAEDILYETVMRAEWYKTADIIQVVDIPEKEQDFTGYLTGFPFLNRALHGFLNGQLTVHTGDSKAGKSTALTQISAECIAQGAKVCAWSGEDDRNSYKYRMDVHLGGYDGTEIKLSKAGREYAVLLPQYRTAVDLFLRDKLFLFDKRVGVNENNLVETFELAYRRYGCDVFIVDNLMKIVSSKDTNQQYFRQAQIINKLSDFAKDFGVHVHVATHINKAGADDEPPTKNSVSGAKEITNLADIVLSWWRIPETAKAKFNHADAVCSVLANRVFGDEPIASLRYDWRIKRFAENGLDLRREYFTV